MLVTLSKPFRLEHSTFAPKKIFKSYTDATMPWPDFNALNTVPDKPRSDFKVSHGLKSFIAFEIDHTSGELAVEVYWGIYCNSCNVTGHPHDRGMPIMLQAKCVPCTESLLPTGLLSNVLFAISSQFTSSQTYHHHFWSSSQRRSRGCTFSDDVECSSGTSLTTPMVPEFSKS